MTLEYISTSKTAIEDMANKLAHSKVEEKVTGPNSSQLMTSQVTDNVPDEIGDITHCIDGKQRVYIFHGGDFHGNFL